MAQSVAFRNERRCDASACQIAGTSAFVSGLRVIYRYWPTTKPFWNIEVAPIVSAGFLLPLSELYGRFIHISRIHDAAAGFLATQMNRMQPTAQDPAPLLRERIAATPACIVTSPDSGVPAIDLLNNLPDVERRLVSYLFPGKASFALRKIPFDEAGRSVYEPAWRALVHRHAVLFAGMNPSSVPDLIRDLPSISAQVPNPPGRLLDEEQRVVYLRSIVHYALALVLMKGGWEVKPEAGELVFSRNGNHMNLSQDLKNLESGSLSKQAWTEQWRQMGLAEEPLVPCSADPGPRGWNKRPTGKQ